jgi:ADP-ribosylglycohydrolase
VNRRRFLSNGISVPAVAYALSGSGLQGEQAASGNVSLRDKFYGCIIGVHVGSAFGAPVEGRTYQEIEAKHGTLDKLQPYGGKNWNRPPGTTEDGVERQKLMISAIIEKQDRVTAEDVRKIWVRDIKPEFAGTISEAFESVLLAMAKSGIPACDLGRYCDYAGLNSFARSNHVIGLINAGDIEGAVSDVFEVGQLYQTTNSRGLQWAAITCIAIAAATKPGATVDSVIGSVLAGDPRFARPAGEDRVKAELERGLKITQPCKDFRELRKAFDDLYSGKGTPYAFASASEVVTKGICIFYMCKGNLKETMISAANMGRDTDCLTAVSAGIAGALSGSAGFPEEWVRTTDAATAVMKYTNNRRTIKESVDGLYGAYRARLRKMRSFADQMPEA